MTSTQAGGPAGLGPPEGALRLLLVEDDAGDALLVRALLDEVGLGHDLSWVRTLDEALGRLDVDCVLLDLGLPDAFGLPAVERLLAAGAPAVVVLTGLSDGSSGVAAVAAGAQDFLVKGEVDADGLDRSVRYAVQRRRLESTDRALYRSLVRAAEMARLERALVPVPILRDARLELRVGYRAGREGVLGGDFFDVVERGDGHVLVMIGDVCGHGPDEAALGATLRTAWRTLVLADVPVAGILPLLERVLVAERGDPWVFTTLCMLDVAPGRDGADVYLAGHPAPIRLGERPSTLPVHARGRALGVPVPGGWAPAWVPLRAPWRVMLYTDGLIEATVDGGPTRLGKDGLLSAAGAAERAYGDTPPGTVDDPLVRSVLRHVHDRHGGDLVDDAAIVVVGWPG